MAAGNINITAPNTGTLIHSEAGDESIDKRNKLVKHVEKKHIQRALQVRIPTNDEQVKYRLRHLKEPICFFGENAAARRTRLHNLLTHLVSEGKTIPNFKDGSQPEYQGDLSVHKRKAFWAEGDGKTAKLRKKTRLKLLTKSLENSKLRLEKERQRRTREKFQVSLEFERMEKSLKTFVSQVSIPADTRPLTCVKFSPDGKTLATGARTGFAKVWDTHGNLKCVVKGHQDRISDLVWNPKMNEKVGFITGGCDMGMHMWGADGTKVGSFPVVHENRISKMAWHPHANLCISTSFDKTWITWDIETCQSISRQPGHNQAVYACAIHPDGSLCATSDLKGHIRLWDMRKGQHLMGFTEHVKQVLALDFSPKGYLFASGSDDNVIRIWDLRKKNSPYAIAAHGKSITSVKFQPQNGNYLMSASKDNTVKFWNGKRFSLIHTCRGHEDAISCADLSPDGRLLATASFDRTFKLWGAEEQLVDD